MQYKFRKKRFLFEKDINITQIKKQFNILVNLLIYQSRYIDIFKCYYLLIKKSINWMKLDSFLDKSTSFKKFNLFNIRKANIKFTI